MNTSKEKYYVFIREAMASTGDGKIKKVSIHQTLESALLARDAARDISFIKTWSIHGPFGAFDIWDLDTISKKVEDMK